MRRRAVVLTGAWIAIVAVVWWGWLRSPTLGDVRAVAERFEPSPGWVLLEQTARNRGPLCIDTECPSLNLRWETGEPPTRAELEQMIAAAGWTATVEGSCIPRSNVTGSSPLCSAVAREDGIELVLGVAGPLALGTGPTYWVTLHAAAE